VKKKGAGTGWTAGKIAAVAVSTSLVVAVLAVTMIMVIGGIGGQKSGMDGTIGEEEMVEAYEEIKQDAETAMDEMEDLTSEEATSDPEVYEQQLEETLTVYNQLLADLEEAIEAVIEVSEDYEELYAYIYEYYDYLYALTEQAAGEIEYLLSLVPTMQEIQQMEQIVERLGQLPAAGQYGELSTQLDQAVQKALSNLEGVTTSDTLSSYGSSMESLARQLDSLSQQMNQYLASGNKAAFNSLADQMNATVISMQQQLSSAITSLSSSYTSMLSQLEASIQSALP
jgi:predicted PurR-regulated permease PerM